jgi:hypothetical protein
VVGVFPRDDDLSFGLIHEFPVTPDNADQSVDRLGPGPCIKRVIQLRLRRWRICALEEAVVVRQLAHLLFGRVDQFVPAIACVDTPQPGHTIEDPVAVNVVYVNVVGARDDAALLFPEVLVIGKWVEVVTAIEFLPLFSGA